MLAWSNDGQAAEGNLGLRVSGQAAVKRLPSVVYQEIMIQEVFCRAMMNSKIEMRIERVVPSGDRILVDAEQRFSPWFWPSAILSPLGWRHHVLMTTVDNPAG